MQESPEIEALVRRGIRALNVDHDMAAFRNIWVGANHPDTRLILLAEAEWYQGMNSPLVQELAMNRAMQLGTTDVVFEQLEAFEHGDTEARNASLTM